MFWIRYASVRAIFICGLLSIKMWCIPNEQVMLKVCTDDLQGALGSPLYRDDDVFHVTKRSRRQDGKRSKGGQRVCINGPTLHELPVFSGNFVDDVKSATSSLRHGPDKAMCVRQRKGSKRRKMQRRRACFLPTLPGCGILYLEGIVRAPLSSSRLLP